MHSGPDFGQVILQQNQDPPVHIYNLYSLFEDNYFEKNNQASYVK